MAKNKNYKDFKKDRRRRKLERELRQQDKFERLLQANPVHHKVNVSVVDDIFNSGKRKVGQNHPFYGIQKQIESLKRDDPYRIALYQVLRVIARQCKSLLEQNIGNRPLPNGLVSLCKQHQYWIRQPEDWKPNSRNTERRFGSLARHLMAKYQVPDWLDGVYQAEETWHDLFPHVAQGANIRKWKPLAERVPLTKKMAHLLMCTPARFSFVKGIRRTQALSLGASETLAVAIASSQRLSDIMGPTMEAFWFTVIQWLANNPMIASDQISPMLDYINNQREHWDGDGPYTIRGRSATRMFADMQEWHRELRQARHLGSYRYYTGPFEPSGYEEHIWEVSGGKSKVIWTVEELLHSKELMREGAALHHCVYSYSNSIKRGNCSIWSLRKNGEPRVTIQVNQSGSIVQVRGACNSLPKPEEELYVQQWADINSLHWSRS